MTIHPLEIYHDEVWEILDPDEARVVAIFYNETAAREYLEWRNQQRGTQ